MLLSSADRIMQYCGFIDAAGDDPKNRRNINAWLPAISTRIEKFLNRKLHIEQYTEYWDSREDVIEYLVQAAPVIQINSVMASSMGLYTGEEYLIINYYPSRFGHAISLNYPVTRWRKGLRAIYTGGMAYHGTQSVFGIGSSSGSWAVGKFATTSGGYCAKVVAVDTSKNFIKLDNLYGLPQIGDILIEQDSEFVKGSSTGLATITDASDEDYTKIHFALNSVVGTFTVGKYVKGLSSGCVGQIVAVGSNCISVQWYYFGSASNFFIEGEAIQEQDDYLNIGTSDASAILTAFIARALCEVAPQIVTACEIEMRYVMKHQFDFENQGTYKEQTSRRPDKFDYVLQPETIALLDPYRRYLI